MISDIPGIWLHHTSDCQKYFVLKAKPSLITDGLWSLSRNPNYLGELFILGAFAGLIAVENYQVSVIICHHSRFRLESPDVVVVLADAGRHPGGKHVAGHGWQGEVPVQVSPE